MAFPWTMSCARGKLEPAVEYVPGLIVSVHYLEIVVQNCLHAEETTKQCI